MILLSSITQKVPHSSLGPQYYPRLLVLFLAAFFSILAAGFGWNALAQGQGDAEKLKHVLLPGLQLETTDIFVSTLIAASVCLAISVFTLICLGISLYPRTKDLSTHAMRVQVVFLTLGALCLLGTMIPYLIIFETHHVGISVLQGDTTSALSVASILGQAANSTMNAGAGTNSYAGLTAYTKDITANTVPLNISSSESNLLKEYRDIPYLVQFAVVPWLSIIANLVAAGLLFYQTYNKDVDESELHGLGFEYNSSRSMSSLGGTRKPHRPFMMERALFRAKKPDFKGFNRV